MEHMNDNICDECGEPLDQAEFNQVAELVNDALQGASQENEMGVLVMFLGRFLSGICAEDREFARSEIIQMIDDDTKFWVQRGCDA
jgi:hypothetical protein